MRAGKAERPFWAAESSEPGPFGIQAANTLPTLPHTLTTGNTANERRRWLLAVKAGKVRVDCSKQL
jgi:hypothetical protein